MSKRKQYGFTLIELLGVLTIMAVLMAITITSFKGIKGSTAEKAELYKIKSTMSLARQHAITKREKVFVLFPTYAQSEELGYHSYGVFHVDPGNAGKLLPLSEWYTLPLNVFFDPDVQLTGNVFRPDNTCADAYIVEELNPGGVRYQMIEFQADGSVKKNSPRIYPISAVNNNGVLIPVNESLTTRTSLRINRFTGRSQVLEQELDEDEED